MGSSKKIDITRFDPTNASDDQIRLWLFAIIQAELEKDDAEIDEELIDECSDCEAFLSHNNPEISQEEYALGLARIKAKAQAIQAESPNIAVQAKPKKRRFMRVAVYFLAAALAVAILTVGVVAAFSGSAAWEFIMTNIKQIVGMEPGDTLDDDKVTLIKGDLVAEYDSVEEALKAGGFEGILYPTVLPDGIKTERIIYSHNGNSEKYRLIFITNNDNISYSISNYDHYTVGNWASAEILVINNITYYVEYISEKNEYQIGFTHKEFEHILTITSYDDLINILNSMEELK